MKDWIEEHREELWRWIENCFDENGANLDVCRDCPAKEACDEVWDRVKVQ